VPALADTYLDTAAASEEDRLWGSAVSIRRGGATTTAVTMQQRIGEWEVVDFEGRLFKVAGCEWIVTKARYLVNGVAVQPLAGDRITEANGTIWEVLPSGDKQESDELAGGLEWLIRSKRISNG
jgi:hypothetical protein